MSPRSKQQFEKMREDRRKAIMNAALKVFSEYGYQGATISKVSQEAGVSKGLMYNYFESKEALLHQLLDDLFAEEIEVIRKIDAENFDSNAFRNYLNHLFDLFRENKEQWKLYLSLSTQPHVFAVVLKKYQAEYAFFGQCVFEFFKSKGYPNPTLTMSYFYTTLAGIKIQAIMNAEQFPLDEIKILLFEQFIDKTYVSDTNE